MADLSENDGRSALKMRRLNVIRCYGLPDKTSSQAERIVWPTEFSALHTYSPASSTETFTKGSMLTLERFSRRGCGGNKCNITPSFMKTENMHNRGSLNHFLTVSAVRSGDPSGPWRLLSFLNHWRRVEAGWWSLHTSFTCPPTNTVAFSGNPGIRIGRETRISGGTEKMRFWTTTSVISL